MAVAKEQQLSESALASTLKGLFVSNAIFADIALVDHRTVLLPADSV